MAQGISLNRKAIEAIIASKGVQDDLLQRGEAIAKAAGAGYAARPGTGKGKNGVLVEAVTPEAQLDNARNNTLVRSLHAGR